jgi:pyruvate/2-oxoglutarate dehydrogenase complex dihydrolipoamide acyltransferase (E2) component
MATGTTAVQTIDVVTPAAGESVTEGTILEWHDTIVEISTDKVDVELPSPGSGIVSEILVEEGETVTVGQVIARISVNGSAPAAAPVAEPQLDEPAEQPLAAEPQAEVPAAPEAAEPAGQDHAPAGNGSVASR